VVDEGKRKGVADAVILDKLFVKAYSRLLSLKTKAL